jgi:hypothetical protein
MSGLSVAPPVGRLAEIERRRRPMHTVAPESEPLRAEMPPEVPPDGPDEDGPGDTGETEDVPEDLGEPGTQGPAA